MAKKEFEYTFQITKTIVFEVNYHTVGSNKSPYFSTSAAVFNRPKSDYNRCGQCQNDVLFGLSMKFFKKWDELHLKDLTVEQYNNLIVDIELLKHKYNFIDNVRFSNIRELSKLPLKKA